MNIPIDVVIPTKNSERTLKDCLESLKNQSIPCQIIIVDAYSVDGTIEIAKEYTNLIYNEPITKNKRRSPEARNEGLRHSTSEYVAFIDSDAVAPSTWLEDALKYFTKSNIASVTSGGQHGETGRLGLAIYRVMQLGSTHARSFNKVEEIDSTPGYNAIYLRKAIDDVGMFSELGGAEDWELNWRLRRDGWKILGIPEAPVIHYERDSLKGFFKQMEHNGWTKSMLLKKKHIFTLKFALPFLVSIGTLYTVLIRPDLLPLILTLTLAGETSLTIIVKGGLYEFFLFIVMHLAWAVGYIEGFFS